MSTPLQLFEMQDALADASGIATFTFAPTMRGEIWNVQNIGVTNDGAATPQANCYRNSVSPGNRFTGTVYATSDNDTGVYRFQVGERLIVQFNNCSVGSKCTAKIEGQKIIPGSGFYSPY